MNIDILLAGFDASQIEQAKSIIPLLAWAIGAAIFSVAVGIYTFLQMRKMQKKNQPKPNQLDGTIADEGISFYDLAGSPHVHANITDIWDKETQAIKKKSGGFLGIGKTSQVTGYRYYAKFAAFIGNRIEKLIAINFDNRKWVIHDPLKHPPDELPVREGNLFGENEGGVSGIIDIEFGYPDAEPNLEYQKYFPLVSGYPYQSYLVFRSLTGGAPSLGEGLSPAGFYLGNSGYMKEMLLWVKRTRVRNDGREQWYKVRGDGAIVCEIGAFRTVSDDEKLSTGDISFIQDWEVAASNGMNSSDRFSGTWGLPSDLSLFSSIGLSGDIGEGGSLEVLVSFIAQGHGIASVEFFYTHLKDKVPNLALNGLFNIKKEELAEGSTQDIITTYKIVADFFISQGFELIANTSENAEYDATILFDDIRIFDPRIGSLGAADGMDINPIHKIREILTDDTAMGKPESDVNDVNLMKAADRIWDEGLGVSWAIDEKSCIDAIEELCYHIEAGIRVNRQTGLYEMVLFRDDWFSEDEIHDISENKIKDLSLEVMNSDDIVNQLNVTYYDRERIKNSTFSVSETGSILTMGHANAESIDFPYFMNMRNAEIVANWKLKQFSTPAWSGSFTTGWREARKWNRYDLIRLPWSKKWNGTILVRIMKINLGSGTDNTVTIDFEEVIPYSGEMSTSIVADASMEEKTLPPQAAQYEPFELPYYFAVMMLGQRQIDGELTHESRFGLVGVVAERPQSNSMYAIMETHSGVEGGDWVRAATIDYSPTAALDQIITKTTMSFVIKNSKDLSNVPVGTLIKCGRDWLGTPGEWMVFLGIDPYTGVVSVKRGVLDTLPQEWGFDTKLYFCGADVAYDSTEYKLGDEVLISALTTTPSGVLEQKVAIPIEMKARAIRPYPPANVKINRAYWPETQLISDNILLTWMHRNRVQQTGVDVIGWYDGDVTVENGVTYSYELISENVVLDSMTGISTNTATISASVLIPNMPHTLKLWSVRDGYISYQKFEHSFFVEAASLILTAAATQSQVIGNTVPVANISVNVEDSLKANLEFDGSSISGKAPAGATVKIEVEE